MTSTTKPKTVGLSNKLYPSLGALAAGVVIAIFVDSSYGLGIIVAALASLGIGPLTPADQQKRE